MSKDCKDTLQTLKTDKTRVRRKVRTEYLSDAVAGRAVEIRKTLDEQFRLQLTSKGLLQACYCKHHHTLQLSNKPISVHRFLCLWSIFKSLH